jgi:glutamine amidotransferase
LEGQVPEFLAIHETDASLLGCLLRRLAGKVSLGPTEAGAGVGFFQSDDVLLRKRPLAGRLPAPERLAEGIESEAALITSGVMGARPFNEQTTLPFRFKRWLFAIAGQSELLTPARTALVAALPEYLRRATKGESAAESLFFTFLARLRDAGRLDDVDVEASTAARALAAAVGEAERAFEQLGTPLPPLAVVATNGRVMAGVRRGHPLWLGLVDGLLPCARCEIRADASALNPRAAAHRALRAAVLVSGAQEAQAGFREVKDGEIVAVPRGLTAESL